MENKERLCCEECGATHLEKPIIEMPKRSAFRAKIEQYSANDGKQQNICMDCMKKKIERAHSIYLIPAHIE